MLDKLVVMLRDRILSRIAAALRDRVRVRDRTAGARVGRVAGYCCIVSQAQPSCCLGGGGSPSRPEEVPGRVFNGGWVEELEATLSRNSSWTS